MTFLDYFAGRNLVVVDPIRRDVMSGGRTATDTLLRAMARVAQRVDTLSFAPGASALLFLVLSWPAVLFVWWSRRSRSVVAEFCTRLSPWLLLRCLWVMHRAGKRPLLVLNHHSVFYLARFFRSSDIVFVWHDVPSLKRDTSHHERSEARRCAAVERWLLATHAHHITLSVDEQRWLRRLHRVHAELAPAVDRPVQTRTRAGDDGMLLVGNWERAENSTGAEQFFTLLARLARNLSARPVVRFHVAGSGADEFVRFLRPSVPPSIELSAVPRYDTLADFDDIALVVPLARGAGIKLKTLEAWAAGIPVVGTPQAFSGLPKHLVAAGGVRARDLTELASLCHDREELVRRCRGLRPDQAYRDYLALTQATPSAAAPT